MDFTEGDLAQTKLIKITTMVLWCHVTFLILLNIYFRCHKPFEIFYLMKKMLFCNGDVFYIFILYLQSFEILTWLKIYGGHI